ncbi:MAG TPA: type 4a pilus biogenesis protein PilO [Terriglobia bacterium]|nr:type 4a pilus biogenesis protein PilO [Terriglobia bacterium]
MAKSLQDYPHRVQAPIFAGLALAVAGIALWYWLMPLNEQRTALAAQVTTLHAQNLANRAIEQQRVVYQQRIAEQETKLQALRDLVPDAPDSDGLVNLVHAAESASGVHVRSLAALPPLMAEEYVELPFKLRADGTYFALVDFFDRLGQAGRITNVTGLALTTPTPTGHGVYKIDVSETVAVDFVLSAYYNRPPGAVPQAKKK